MKCSIWRVSNSGSRKPCAKAEKRFKHWIVEINSLQDIKDLMAECDDPLIIKPYDQSHGDCSTEDVIDWEIRIYDDYIW